MKSVLISIQPKWCKKIANGEKTIEVRKTAPEAPFKCYIYCTKEKPLLGFHTDYVDGKGKRVYTDHLFGNIPYFNGKVIGEFVCDKVDVLFDDNGNPENYMTDILPEILKKTALSFNEFQEYVNNRAKGRSVYGWHISDLIIYDKPKELSEFIIPCRISCENCKNPLYYECKCEEKGVKSISRPPQSWCYVEELKEVELK